MYHHRKDFKLFNNDNEFDTECNTRVTGVHKLAQQFIIELYTHAGSMIYFNSGGCNFVRRVKISATEFDIALAFAAALSKIKRNLQSELDTRTPLEERLETVILDHIIVNDNQLSLVLTVVSRANTTVQVETPAINLGDINVGQPVE